MSTDARPARRGRRPAGTDTRAALLEAARAVFGELGYDRASVRAIATRAGVDPAMVNHWFGGKAGLFAESVLAMPFRIEEIVARVVDGPVEHLGERAVRTFLTMWDGGPERFAALIHSVAGQNQVAFALRDFFTSTFLGRVVRHASPDQHELRTALCATQMLGLGLGRYVVAFDAVVEAPTEALVAAVAPNVQRYLTGSLD